MHKILKTVLKKNKMTTVITIVMSILFALSLSYASKTLTKLFEAVELGEADPIPTLLSSVLYILLMNSLAIIIHILYSLARAKYKYKVSNDLRKEITSKVINIPYSNFDNKNTGNYISWYTADVNQLVSLSAMGFIDIFQSSSMILSAFFFMTYLNIYLGIISVVFLLLSIIIPQFLNSFMRSAQERFTIANEKFTEDTREIIAGFNIFYITNKLAKFNELINSSSDRREKAVLHYNVVNSYVESAVMFISLLSQIGMTIVTVFFSLKGLAPLGAAFAVASLSGIMFSSTGSLVNDIMHFKSVKPIYKKFETETLHTGDQHLPTIQTIDLKNIDFMYEEKEIFSNFNAFFDVSKKYAIIGESGSGKTTLLKIILGLIEPSNGNVYVNKLDIDVIRREDFYSQIAYIDQNVFLFKGTIRDNITLWRDIDDLKITEVLKKVNLTDFVEKQSDGLETILDESGKNISGGEKQRIALARALINDVKLLIVDEATSQLDQENALSIEKMIMEQNDFGVIMVSHHFKEEIIKKFDEIINI